MNIKLKTDPGQALRLSRAGQPALEDIEALVLALGGKMDQRGGGSSRAFAVNGRVVVVDEPHPGPFTPRGLVRRILKIPGRGRRVDPPANLD